MSRFKVDPTNGNLIPIEALDMIASVESSSKFQHPYVLGDQFIYGGTLYTATATVSVGDSISPGSNCMESDALVAQIQSAKASIDAISSSYVSGIKGNAESSYRTGNVNLTSANVGALGLAGGTMTGQIKRSARSVSWAKGRDTALVNMNTYDNYSAVLSQKTTNGSWDLGVYQSDGAWLTYITDADYKAGTYANKSQYSFPPKTAKTMDMSQSIKSISRSGTTFTATRMDDTTFTFTQQDNNTWTKLGGATADADGTAGYCPQPTKGQQSYLLRGNGAWASATTVRSILGLGTSGALPITFAQGGTGATTRLLAAKALTNESVASPTHFVGLTDSWGKFGYSTIAQTRTALGLGAAAYLGTPIAINKGGTGATALTSVFAITTWTKDNWSIGASTNAVYEEKVSKSGWYPLAVIGWYTSLSHVLLNACYLKDRTSGSCNIWISARNMLSSAATVKVNIHFLWLKV